MKKHGFKRVKLEQRIKIKMSLESFLEERGAVIPPLDRSNEDLQSTAHTEDTGHEDATILGGVDNIDIPALLDDKKILTEYREDRSSHLLLQLDEDNAFVYQNESEIQMYVVRLLQDVLLAMGLNKYLKVRPEISVFSYRPDVIVVSQSTMGIVLVVEVKKTWNRCVHITQCRGASPRLPGRFARNGCRLSVCDLDNLRRNGDRTPRR